MVLAALEGGENHAVEVPAELVAGDVWHGYIFSLSGYGPSTEKRGIR
jgi:hypothetical protein